MLSKILRALAWAAVLFASPALADETIRLTPAPAWIKPADIPVLAAKEDQGSSRTLLLNIQNYYGPDGDELYIDKATEVLNAQGLEEVGMVTQSWDPLTENLTIHRLEIIRGDKVIDVLREGDPFVALRRESNLNRAMLDGRLTATKQIEGLLVGDIVRSSMTIKGRDPVLAGHSEYWFTLWESNPLGRLRQRHVWPKGREMRWRATEGLVQPVVKRTASETEILIDADNVKTPIAPKGAPGRFNTLGELELSDFASWKELSALFAPYYKSAATLKADSAVKAEAEKIRQAHSTPVAQAQAALALVQQRVRYLALSMGEGGYRPASADQTWSRKFGDCKGKTVLLLALLSELGIEAKAALVSTGHGDGLSDRLPRAGLFNHVIIRAEIGGRVYWLDGTDFGGGDLNRLSVPAYSWALPLTESGADLEALRPVAYAQAQTETVIEIDSTVGLNLDAPIRIRRTYRGVDASEFLQDLEGASKSDNERNLRERWEKIDWLVIKDLTFGRDASEDGAAFVLIEGKAKDLWEARVGGVREMWVPDSSFSSEFDKREEGTVNPDAPYSLTFPYYARYVVRVRLPRNGNGFDLIGDDVDMKAGGMWVKRRSRIQDGVAIMEQDEQTLASEISAAEAKASTGKFARAATDRQVLLRSPRDFASTTVEMSKVVEAQPDSASAYATRALAYMQAGQTEKARADFDRSLELDPKNIQTLSGRAGLLHTIGEGDAALKDIAKALEIEPENFAVIHLKGLIRSERGEPDLALKDVSEAIALAPNRPEFLKTRAYLHWKANNLDLARTDIDAAVRLSPNDLSLQEARIVYSKRETDPYMVIAEPLEALYTRAIKDEPKRADLYLQRANARQTLQRFNDAGADFDKAVQLDPSASTYRNRASFLASRMDLKAAAKDYDAAVKLDQGTASLVARGYFRMARHDSAGADADLRAAIARNPENLDLVSNLVVTAVKQKEFDIALSLANDIVQKAPRSMQALILRASVRTERKEFSEAIADVELAKALPNATQEMRRGADRMKAYIFNEKGDYAESLAILKNLLAQDPKNPTLFNEMCWQKATRNIEAETAVADCLAALALEPKQSAFLDSLGTAQLRMGHLDAAIEAYSQSLESRPGQAMSLYGRAIARKQKGDLTGSRQDAAAAVKIYPEVAREFGKFGWAL